MLQALRSLAESTAKLVLPAILIALIGQYFILRWQHRYWRIQKITDLQDAAYRNARKALIRMALLWDRIAPHLMATLGTPQGGTKGPSESVITSALGEIAQDRQALAEIAQDVHRLFSEGAEVATADAAKSVVELRKLLMTALSTPAPDPALEAKVKAMVAQSQVLIVRALDQMADEIGRDPRGPWWMPRGTSRFGRRRDDVPAELRGLGEPVDRQAPHSKRPSRRLVDRMWERLARGPATGTGDDPPKLD